MVQKQHLRFCSHNSTRRISYSKKLWESQRKELISPHSMLLLNPKRFSPTTKIENRAFCPSERIPYQGSTQYSDITTPYHPWYVHPPAFVFNGSKLHLSTFHQLRSKAHFFSLPMDTAVTPLPEHHHGLLMSCRTAHWPLCCCCSGWPASCNHIPGWLVNETHKQVTV